MVQTNTALTSTQALHPKYRVSRHIRFLIYMQKEPVPVGPNLVKPLKPVGFSQLRLLIISCWSFDTRQPPRKDKSHEKDARIDVPRTTSSRQVDIRASMIRHTISIAYQIKYATPVFGYVRIQSLRMPISARAMETGDSQIHFIRTEYMCSGL